MADAEGKTIIRNLDENNHRAMHGIAIEHGITIGDVYNRVVGDFLAEYKAGNRYLPERQKNGFADKTTKDRQSRNGGGRF